jgi:uncharacterized membrane protein YeaQ/YmgE (transglycosylase-associated protein family)
MHLSWYGVIVWVLIGLAGGTLAGLIVKGSKRGFGFFANLGLGLAGALAGGLLFRLLGILPNLDKISISARDIVAALAGSILVLGLLWLWRRRGG